MGTVAEITEEMVEETPIAEAPARPVIGSTTPDAGSAEQDEDREVLVVKPGDRVLISYNDEPTRQYTLTLSKTQHDPSMLVINATAPLAQALMGCGEEDEVEIPTGGATRVVTILKIERPAAGNARKAA
jgi:transcription elongation GreA/GreB family factor